MHIYIHISTCNVQTCTIPYTCMYAAVWVYYVLDNRYTLFTNGSSLTLHCRLDCLYNEISKDKYIFVILTLSLSINLD